MTHVDALDEVGSSIDPGSVEALVDAFRVELTGYCYRMLGSAFDADDAVQETMVRAWRGLGGFEGRAQLRSWLYRIATNVCLTMLDRRGRRALPLDLAAPSAGDGALGPPLPETAWVQPVPDERVLPPTADPGDLFERRETIRLAFVAALQLLPARQRAVLILRDVLRWRTSEVADLLDASPVSVKAMLQRARATLAARATPSAGAGPLDHEDSALLARYVDAFQRYDVDELVGLLRRDATLSMPPHALWLRGAADIGRWWDKEGAACRGSLLVPVAANGTTGFAQYRPGFGAHGRAAFALHVVTTAGDGIAAIDIFVAPELFPLFGLPATTSAGRVRDPR